LRRVEDIEFSTNLPVIPGSNNSITFSESKYPPIDSLNLSVRAFNALKTIRVNTIEDLLNLDLDNLSKHSLLVMRARDELKETVDKLKRKLITGSL